MPFNVDLQRSGSVLAQYDGSFKKALFSLFPNIGWDKSQFDVNVPCMSSTLSCLIPTFHRIICILANFWKIGASHFCSTSLATKQRLFFFFFQTSRWGKNYN
jgi:hypothetical protein